MVFSVAPQLWDSLLAVLSSLTQWKEVVAQWKVQCTYFLFTVAMDDILHTCTCGG